MNNQGLYMGTHVFVEKAHAKVNLFLRVGPRREDGFHAVATVLQMLTLHDVVRIEVVTEGVSSQSFSIEVTSDDSSLPTGRANLAWQAVEALRGVIASSHPACRRIHVDIQKNIPVAAGLAGGSADAAAVLRALNRGMRLGLSQQRLLVIGAALGSDVPACIAGGTVYCRGRGEDVEQVAARPFWWVLAHPGGGLSAGQVYQTFDRLAVARSPGDGSFSAPLEQLVPGFKQAVAAGGPRDVVPFLVNDLEPAAVALRPEIAGLIRAFRRHGALAALVSGSGPTVYGLTTDGDEAERLAAALSRVSGWVWFGPGISPGHRFAARGGR